MENEIKAGSTIQMLVANISLEDIVNDWYETNQECDLRLRRAKTKGHTVIETKGVMFACRILRQHPGVRVNIAEPKSGVQAAGTAANNRQIWQKEHTVQEK